MICWYASRWRQPFLIEKLLICKDFRIIMSNSVKWIRRQTLHHQLPGLLFQNSMLEPSLSYQLDEDKQNPEFKICIFRRIRARIFVRSALSGTRGIEFLTGPYLQPWTQPMISSPVSSDVSRNPIQYTVIRYNYNTKETDLGRPKIPRSQMYRPGPISPSRKNALTEMKKKIHTGVNPENALHARFKTLKKDKKKKENV